MIRDQQMKVSKTVANTGLALQARSKVYGEEICADAPSIWQVDLKEGKAYAHFEHTGGFLRVRGNALSGFEIAGRDGVFYPAQGNVEMNTAVLWSEQVTAPVFLRYAWKNYCKANLYGASGLPAAPFRTDQFSI